MARAAREIGAAILHVSTDYVFNGEKADGYTESDPTSPLGAYGKSKLKGEELVSEANPRHWIVRTQWLYGPGGKNFVDTILNLTARRDRIEVVDDQIGCPTYSADLARQLVALVELKPPWGIYHCSGKGACSWFELAEAIVELSEKKKAEVIPVSSKSFVRPARRPAYSVLHNLRLEQTIGDGMRPWKEALRDYLATRRSVS